MTLPPSQRVTNPAPHGVEYLNRLSLDQIRQLWHHFRYLIYARTLLSLQNVRGVTVPALLPQPAVMNYPVCWACQPPHRGGTLRWYALMKPSSLFRERPLVIRFALHTKVGRFRFVCLPDEALETARSIAFWTVSGDTITKPPDVTPLARQTIDLWRSFVKNLTDRDFRNFLRRALFRTDHAKKAQKGHRQEGRTAKFPGAPEELPRDHHPTDHGQ